jgi:hypothetical protein
MNEDIFRPRDYELQAIQTLISSRVGLRLTSPLNPGTGDERTWSIQNASLTIRFDYILPCGLLLSNLSRSQVFRSDKVSPSVPPMLASDSATASDHLPVAMTFRNPYDVPFAIRNLTLSNQVATITWQTVMGARYRVEVSADLTTWTPATTNLTAPGSELSCKIPGEATSQYLRVAREP